LLIASLALLASIAGSAIDVEPSMLLGQATRESKSLLSEDAEGFYALQLTTRDNRLCQVRAFFRGSSPRTARYCSGRVTGRQVARSGVAVLGVGEVVQGIGACLSSDRRIIAVRFYTRAGAEVTAQTETCTGSYQQVRCRGDWVVQGVQFILAAPAGCDRSQACRACGPCAQRLRCPDPERPLACGPDCGKLGGNKGSFQSCAISCSRPCPPCSFRPLRWRLTRRAGRWSSMAAPG